MVVTTHHCNFIRSLLRNSVDCLRNPSVVCSRIDIEKHSLEENPAIQRMKALSESRFQPLVQSFIAIEIAIDLAGFTLHQTVRERTSVA